MDIYLDSIVAWWLKRLEYEAEEREGGKLVAHETGEKAFDGSTFSRPNKDHRERGNL